MVATPGSDSYSPYNEEARMRERNTSVVYQSSKAGGIQEAGSRECKKLYIFLRFIGADEVVTQLLAQASPNPEGRLL